LVSTRRKEASQFGEMASTSASWSSAKSSSLFVPLVETSLLQPSSFTPVTMPRMRRASTSSIRSISLRRASSTGAVTRPQPCRPTPTRNADIDPRLLEDGTSIPDLSSSSQSTIVLTDLPSPHTNRSTPPACLDPPTDGSDSSDRKSWRRRRGWRDWANETVATPNMVPALILQAFSTGILDATTYADFNTFASNRQFPLL